MERNGMTFKRLAAALLVFAYVAHLVVVPVVWANPNGPAVVGGHATISGLGTSHVTIAQGSQQAIINWQQFNIASNEVTQFIQPNVHAMALNRIFDQDPSQIFGSLRANGTVILLNHNGIMFGPNAQINVGGLIASTLKLTNANFLAGHYLFQGAGVEGPVKNMGAIQGLHDWVYLLAPNVENSGIITSPTGNIVLAAGAKAFLSHRPDGQGFSRRSLLLSARPSTSRISSRMVAISPWPAAW
jgi:filamentous hemagglutinin family protein